LPTVIEIESDRFKNLKYDEEVFKTEAGAVYGEFRKGRTNPLFVLYEATVNNAFDAHTYKHTTIGFEADIERMPQQYEYSKSFFSRFYRPENVVILVVGDFDTKETLGLIRQHYSDWKPGYAAPEIPTEPPQTEARRIDVPFEGQVLPVVSVNFKGERFLPTDRTMVAAMLIPEIAFSETSPLYRKLVLEEQRVQVLEPAFGISPQYPGFFYYNRDPKLWSIDAMIQDPADVHAVEAEIWTTIRMLQATPVDQKKLDAARSRLKYQFLSDLTTPYAVATKLARTIALTGDMTAIDDLYSTFDQVTPEDIRTAAREYLQPERSTTAILHTAGLEIPAKQAVAGPEPVLLPVENDPNVVFKAWFRVGSQDDPPGKEGLAALTAALVTESGTRDLTYDQILEKLYPLAAGFEASVDKEMTVITGAGHRDIVGTFYELFREAMLRPGFRQEDFERLRSQALTAIEKTLRYSSDEELGKAALFGRVFAGTPYEHLNLGTVKSLKSLTLEDIREFHAAHYTRENFVIGLGGAYGDEMTERFGADLQGLPEGVPDRIDPPRPASIKGRQVILVEKPGATSTAISFGYPVDVHRGSREFYALWIANSWLGEHRNSVSRLYQVIRETRGMNYGDYSYIEAFPQGGRRSMPPTGVGRRQQLFEVWIRPVPEDQALFALRAALREVASLATAGMTAEQFETQREFLKKYSLQFATTTEERLGYAIDDRFYAIDDGHLDRFRRIMDEMTLDEVNAAIRKHIRADDLVIAMVTGDAVAMKKALVSGAPTPIDYGEIRKSQEILDADVEIAAYPLEISAGAVVVVPVDRMFEK
jgi:zinc protease